MLQKVKDFAAEHKTAVLAVILVLLVGIAYAVEAIE